MIRLLNSLGLISLIFIIDGVRPQAVGRSTVVQKTGSCHRRAVSCKGLRKAGIQQGNQEQQGLSVFPKTVLQANHREFHGGEDAACERHVRGTARRA